jgi:hypothetical protein
MPTGKLSNSTVSLVLITIAAILVIVAYLHGNSDATRGMMFTFAGGIVTGAFAFLNGDSKKNSDLPDLPPPGSTATSDTHVQVVTPPKSRA